jgi:hypothetical protein
VIGGLIYGAYLVHMPAHCHGGGLGPAGAGAD